MTLIYICYPSVPIGNHREKKKASQSFIYATTSIGKLKMSSKRQVSFVNNGMDKKEIRQIRVSMTKIRRQVSRAREGLKSVRIGVSVVREWVTDMHNTNASMVHRIQEGKRKNDIYKVAIRRFSPNLIINAKATETVRRLNHEMLLVESQIFKEGIEHFNLAKPLKSGDLFPNYFYKATAIMQRKN